MAVPLAALPRRRGRRRRAVAVAVAVTGQWALEEVDDLGPGRREAGRDPDAPPRAVRLVEADDDVTGAVLGQLHRLDVRRPVDADEGLDGGAGTTPQRQGERVPGAGGGRDVGAGYDRVPEHVPALVGVGVGEPRRAEQGGAQGRVRRAADARLAGHVVAVRRVVGQGDAVPGLGDQHPPVGAHLEAGGVPAGVDVGRPDDVPELGLEGRVVGVDVAVDGELEHVLALVPVDLGVDLDPVALEPHPLPDAGAAEGAGDHDRVAFHDHRLGVGEVGDGAAVVGVEVPRVPTDRVVGVELEQVGGPARGDQLATGASLHDRPDHSTLVEHDPQLVVLEGRDVVRDGRRGSRKG